MEIIFAREIGHIIYDELKQKESDSFIDENGFYNKTMLIDDFAINLDLLKAFNLFSGWARSYLNNTSRFSHFPSTLEEAINGMCNYLSEFTKQKQLQKGDYITIAINNKEYQAIKKADSI